jgi:iron complex outermembrane receptor protein
VNRTAERRTASASEFESGEVEGGTSSRHTTRGGGSVGVIWTAWKDGADALRVFADYRNTFKPAAIDFGVEAEGDILLPETAKAYEAGVKSAWLDGRLTAELTAFQMDFRNVVISQVGSGGNPELVNAGTERFRGAELGTSWAFRDDLRARLSYANHDARFRDFLTEFDGTPTQLRGKRFEMTPRDLASLGVVWAPPEGWRASTEAAFVGERFLNKRNTALADDYVTWNAGVGYRFPSIEVRLDGRNLNDARDPVSESEVGDAQYYRLPARAFWLSARWTK